MSVSGSNSLTTGLRRSVFGVFVLLMVLGSCSQELVAQRKPGRAAKPKTTKTKTGPATELARLREDFVKATNEYKASLQKLRASYEKNVGPAENRLKQSQELFAQGLLSKKDVEASERAVAEANEKVNEVNQRLASADTQIAQTLLEAETEMKLAKSRIPKGGTLRTTAFIRYNGGSSWGLGDAWKVQRFFFDAFKKPLPITVFGQGSIHDRWRLDHRNAIDVSLHPDGAEGQALLNFLRTNGIPFLAFRAAIPGTATGPHIHVGRPSHRY